ncbi:MAG: small multi-drug export protein [Clostridia bacterium]|nr:small multi-drug export protein [Clostridia bacterium]
MVNQIVEVFVEFLESNNIPTALIPFIVSLFPVLELRGGMIAAFILEVPFIQAFIVCFLGNMIPIPFILLFIRKIFKLMRKSKLLGKIVDKMEARANKKQDTMLKFKEWGLLLFVAIPFPGTGGWTGALIAALMDLRFKKCLPIITIGVLIAGLIMSLVTYGIF